MKKLKVAIIGAGSVAHFHAWAVEQLPEQATLVAVQSNNPAPFAAQYGAKPCHTLDELLELDLDAILVTTPPMHHHDVAIPFLAKGVHALVEKPLTSFTWQARAMLEAAQAGGAMVSTCCQREFLPPVQRVKKAITRRWPSLCSPRPTRRYIAPSNTAGIASSWPGFESISGRIEARRSRRAWQLAADCIDPAPPTR